MDNKPDAAAKTVVPTRSGPASAKVWSTSTQIRPKLANIYGTWADYRLPFLQLFDKLLAPQSRITTM